MHDIERALARALDSHADHLRGGTSPIEGHVHSELSARLERLLQAHWLAGGHSRFRRFDGLVEAVYEVAANGRFRVRGLMAWSEGHGPDRFDHFAADLRLDAGRQDLASYTLRFGRQERDGHRLRWAHVFTQSPRRTVRSPD